MTLAITTLDPPLPVIEVSERMPRKRRARTKNVLLIGAFANGNLGDVYQLQAVAEHLRASDPNIVLSAVSPTAREIPYFAPGVTIHERAKLRDPLFLNTFDALIIGGGGLLSSGHWPLNDEAWVSQIKTRMIGVSLGAAPEVVDQFGAFVRKCHAISVRDEFSFDAVKTFGRSDVTITLDPIFVSSDIFTRYADYEAKPDPQPKSGICFIPGKMLPATQKLYEKFASKILARNDSIVSMNMQVDRTSGLDAVFGTRSIYARTDLEMMGAMFNHKVVVSERYHGCIYALRLGIPSVGLVLRSKAPTSKIVELFNLLGLTKALHDREQNWSRAAFVRNANENFNAARIETTVENGRADLQKFLRAALA